MQVMVVFLLILVGALSYLVTPTSPVVNVKLGIRGGTVVTLPSLCKRYLYWMLYEGLIVALRHPVRENLPLHARQYPDCLKLRRCCDVVCGTEQFWQVILFIFELLTATSYILCSNMSPTLLFLLNICVCSHVSVISNKLANKLTLGLIQTGQ